MRNDRGVALIIVLLVTALLMALIFEFAYGTRISLRAAVNFRDTQRAHYLARSGVNFVGMLLADNLKKGKLQDNLEQREWQPLPFIPVADAEITVRWEDEGGKLNINTVNGSPADFNRLAILFTNRGVNQEKLNQLRAWMTEERKNFTLLTELHRFLSDEEYRNIVDSLMVAPIGALPQININTASADVLQGLGLDPVTAERIVEKRGQEPFDTRDKINLFSGMNPSTAGLLALSSNVFRVHSYATVGGYTRQIEAVITRSAAGFTVNYWRAL